MTRRCWCKSNLNQLELLECDAVDSAVAVVVDSVAGDAVVDNSAEIANRALLKKLQAAVEKILNNIVGAADVDDDVVAGDKAVECCVFTIPSALTTTTSTPATTTTTTTTTRSIASPCTVITASADATLSTLPAATATSTSKILVLSFTCIRAAA
ncbi:hypothetical protein GQ42DRAFT_153775 [Ramicandelaber brevisporus]|nr:hypothetical protein GQ42DRAFT_153775 [Ramicandelaber brevisporus]